MAAVAVGPVAGAVWKLSRRDRATAVEWLPLAVLLAHQTEEWVWPGGFLPYANEQVLGSEAEEWPITRRAGFVINVGFGWGLSALAPVVGDRAPWVRGVNVGMLAGNVAMHTSAAVKQRRYNPGVLTALVLFCPTIAATWPAISRLPDAQHRQARVGVGGGTVASAMMFLVLRRRARHGRTRG